MGAALKLVEEGYEMPPRDPELDTMLRAFLERAADDASLRLEIRLIGQKIDVMSAEVSESRAWQREHEEKDDLRHRELSAGVRDLTRVADRHEHALAQVPSLDRKVDALEDTQTRLRIDELTKAIAIREEELSRLRKRSSKPPIHGWLTKKVVGLGLGALAAFGSGLAAFWRYVVWPAIKSHYNFP